MKLRGSLTVCILYTDTSFINILILYLTLHSSCFICLGNCSTRTAPWVSTLWKSSCSWTPYWWTSLCWYVLYIKAIFDIMSGTLRNFIALNLLNRVKNKIHRREKLTKQKNVRNREFSEANFFHFVELFIFIELKPKYVIL